MGLLNAIVDSPENMTGRRKLRDRLQKSGIEQRMKDLEQRIKLLREGSPPESPISQMATYQNENKTDLVQVSLELAQRRRKSVPKLHSLKTSRNTLEPFEGDPDINVLLVETFRRLKNGFGINDKSLMLDLWTICNRFTHHISQIRQVEDCQPFFQNFLEAVKPIIEKYSPSWTTELLQPQSPTPQKVKLPTISTDAVSKDEEMEALKDVIDQLSEVVTGSETWRIRARSERRSLLEKIYALQNEVDELRSITSNVVLSPTVKCSMDLSSILSPLTPRTSRSVPVPRSPVTATTPVIESPMVAQFRKQSMTKATGISVMPSPPPPPPPPPAPALDALLSSSESRPRMKQLFWTKIPPSRIAGTIWEESSTHSSDRSGGSRRNSIRMDTAELEEMFRNNISSVQKKVDNSAAFSSIKKVTTLLEWTRANNIGIMLARIKLTYPEIRRSILLMDDGLLTIDNLKSMRRYVPTIEEIKLLRNFEGERKTLGDAERYFIEMMEIDRLPERLDCMIFRRHFQKDENDLSKELETMEQAIVELRSSKKLKRLLRVVLKIGNHLNVGTTRGNAHGFNMDTLIKLTDTKPSEVYAKDTPTLIHYLVRLIETNSPDLMSFMDELPHLEAATKVSFGTIMASVKSLVDGMQLICNEIVTLNLSGENPRTLEDRFVDVMELFLVEAAPILTRTRRAAAKLDEDVKRLFEYFGEDTVTIKIEDLYGIMWSFSSSLKKAQKDNEIARMRALRRAQRLPLRVRHSYTPASTPPIFTVPSRSTISLPGRMSPSESTELHSPCQSPTVSPTVSSTASSTASPATSRVASPTSPTSPVASLTASPTSPVTSPVTSLATSPAASPATSATTIQSGLEEVIREMRSGRRMRNKDSTGRRLSQSRYEYGSVR